ncbi:MAG TPA: hypothetical protein VMV18_15890 [bacterium]|nr:hypothetical protein [bacterium]
MTVTGREPTAGSYQIQQNAHLTLTTGADVLQHASDWTFVFTPTAGSWVAPWTPADGTMTVNGSWGATVNALTVNAIVTSTTPLTLATSCATRVTAGTLQAGFAATKADAKTHQLIVTWTGCGQTTRTLDGTPVP